MAIGTSEECSSGVAVDPTMIWRTLAIREV